MRLDKKGLLHLSGWAATHKNFPFLPVGKGYNRGQPRPYPRHGCGNTRGRPTRRTGPRQRWRMSIPMLLIVWAILTTILIILLIYRSTLTMREDDQLFLDDSGSHMEQEQKELLTKVNKLTPIVNVL